MPVTARKGSGGRPSREAAAALGTLILDKATALFLQGGYGDTSIEAIARAAGISKRTFYHRYPDKQALFAAVLQRIVADLHAVAGAPLLQGDTAEAQLAHLAQLILQAALSPQALALSRLMLAEASRFPELAPIFAAQGGGGAAVDLIAGILSRHSKIQVSGDDAHFAARQFLQMIISWPQRLALGLGTPLSAGQQKDWAERSVRLFLRGWTAGFDLEDAVPRS